ncbi:MAG: outer membrane beta-barrel protein [Bacteroidales bacterium]|nr:outer membrane beta-barrel protein [Bacteroidales bacterium]MBR5861840.1 outer membrane beta-barrel protein [Bacteroidales bacterium]
MKKYIYILMAAAMMLFVAGEANAQMGKRYYVNGGWQFNGTVGNDFVTNAQGYGAYVEGGYYISPMIAFGGFASFGTNNEYIPKQTYQLKNGAALTTDLDRSIYQVPFGATMRLRFMHKEFQPYFEAKVGAEYSTQSTYMSTFVNNNDNWGFYVSPEVGFTFFPFHQADFGFQVAAYYSYATNANKSYGIEGLNNLGFKLGIAF